MTRVEQLRTAVERLEAERADRQEQSDGPGDDGPRETGSGHDDRPWEHSRAYEGCRYEEAEMAENGVPTDTGYHLF
jgi:hypothetical protein